MHTYLYYVLLSFYHTLTSKRCFLRNAYFIHSRDVTKPSHPSFSDLLLKTYLSCSFLYVFICDFVPPGETKTASQPPVVCCFQFLAQFDGKRPFIQTKTKNCYATSIQISDSGSGQIICLISGAIWFRPDSYINCYRYIPRYRNL